MRSQLSGHRISSNWVGNVVVLFQFSKLSGGGGRIQEESDVCSSCNRETTGVKPPPWALLGPDGDTRCHAGDA